MSISSQKFIASVRHCARSVEQELRDAEQQCSSVTQSRLDYQLQLTELLNRLASFRVDSNDLDACQSAKQQMAYRIDEEKQHRNELEKVELQISELVSQLNEAMSNETAQINAIDQSLLSDPSHLNLVLTRNQVANDLNILNQIALEIKAESADKLPAYKKDGFFQYLISRQFGTENYKSNFFTKTVDTWLASVTNFRVNFINQSMLEKMVKVIHEREGELKSRLDCIQTDIDNSRMKSEDNGEMRVVREKIHYFKLKISSEKKRANELHALLEQYASKKDYRYVEAQRLMIGYFSSIPNEELVKQAALTSSKEDDEVIEKYNRIKAHLEQVEEQYKQLSEVKKEKEDAYERAKVFERRLRKSDFTGSYYKYNSKLDITSLFAAYMLGNLNSNDVEREVLNYRSVIETPTYSGNNWSETRSTSSRSGTTNNSPFNFGNSDSNDTIWSPKSEVSWTSGTTESSETYSTSDSF